MTVGEAMSEQARCETLHDEATAFLAAREKAAKMARLAEAFEVCGKIGPDAPMLVLRLSSEIETNPEVLQELLDSLRAVFAGPVILIPFDWTQEQIDAEAVRLAVLAEREACARIVESGSFGWWEDIGDLREAVAAMIRARGSK